ncbi:MerR family transcriptional regulator [Bacillus thermotolerans]|uniref:HTH merR-type domain-containing protein n=1 Tax=Bacillus thermotolerans TaxID=1221996 RepID=A0A0F5HY79_BACTR|nr:hypothetical protein [Bacillus thermotolerans]KKB38251.1 hypothetical protein QY97_02784 [Bacillus thermotolerans]KKB39798.1 hypothetical protein QY95_02015 [Bacillus thermotolerans]KKB44233.1 hypothetical protein QY96_03255 [Bacillus thermotolerans]
MEQAYFSSEVAKSLGIGASTLRKYASALEEAGYHFDRGINNSRVFYQKDIITIQRLLKMIHDQNMSLADAVELAMKMETPQTPPAAQQADQAQEAQAPASLSNTEELHERISRLEEQQETLIEVNKELVRELAQYQRWMKDKMEQMEHQEIAIRDRLLLNSTQPSNIKREPPKYRIPSIFSYLKAKFKNKKNEEASFN